MRAKAELFSGQVSEDNDGLGIWFGMVLEDGVVAARVGAEDEPSAGFGFHPEGKFADVDAAVRADLDAGALTPDKRPPGTGGDWTQGGAVFLLGFIPGTLRGHAQFAMFFMLIPMGQ